MSGFSLSGHTVSATYTVASQVIPDSISANNERESNGIQLPRRRSHQGGRSETLHLAGVRSPRGDSPSIETPLLRDSCSPSFYEFIDCDVFNGIERLQSIIKDAGMEN